MHRRTLLRIAVLPLSLLLLTSCFGLRGIKWTKSVVGNGDVTKIRIQMAPDSQDNESGYVWFLLGFPESDDYRHGQTKWDVKGKFNGPKFMSQNTLLRDYILADSTCDEDEDTTPNSGASMSTATVDHWTLLITPGEVATGADRQGRVAISTINIIADSNISNNGYSDSMIVFTGTWDDDGDGMPEEPLDDLIVCTGGASLRLATK